MILIYFVVQVDYCFLCDSLYVVIYFRFFEGFVLKYYFGSRLMILDRNRLGRIFSYFILVFFFLVCFYVLVIVCFLFVFLSFEF